jgi:hypothetical protein
VNQITEKVNTHMGKGLKFPAIKQVSGNNLAKFEKTSRSLVLMLIDMKTCAESENHVFGI